MEFSNQKRSKRIKRAFNILGLLLAVVGLAFFWLKMDIALMVTIGVFAVYVGASVFANLCFISFSTNNAKVTIKYYPIISILKKEYGSVEFAQKSLVDFQIEQALGFADLTIAIKTRRGIAEYPTISLAALNKAEIEQIKRALEEILTDNRQSV